ncbi:hypothetical protein SAMN05421493_12425 [Pseudobutyrivibrio sp. 49]|uniref:hypothetical protein n=1 Tax=Pseudobutyrivibrio sp. 49 TaxID=1855344 RepID=UPI00088E9806|nr:hypothetical protein [Pseudobutyrivibrio sp. 49]SDI72347.1 hypothetical protein SAMN05421493_12425 [Pseudobutyrivibrio sp. 49]
MLKINKYILIKHDIDTLLNMFVMFAMIADTTFLFLLPVNSNDLNSIRLFMVLVGIGINVYMMIKLTYQKKIYRQYPFVTAYLIMMICIIVIICLYSMVTYDEAVIDVLIVAYPYLSLLFVPIYLLLFEDEGYEKIRDRFGKLGVAATIILLLCAAVRMFVGVKLLPGFTTFGSRNGHIRISYRPICFYSVFWIASLILNSKNKKRMLSIMYFALVTGGVLYFVSTRIITLALGAAIVLMILSHTEKGNIRVIARTALLAMIIYVISQGSISKIIESFSVDSSEAGSTLARYMAIAYFKTYTDANPLIGMGFVRPSRPDLRLIWSGPYGKAYFDDLGLLGGFFRMGILGLFVHLIPLLRMLYLLIKMIKNKWYDRTMFIGIVVFLLIGQISLNFLDFQRAFIASFYWAMLEYINLKIKKGEYKFESNNNSCTLE